jgi:hypothetical protein
MMQKYLRVKEQDILDDAYSQFREYLEYPPYVTRKAMETVIADVSVSDAAAKNSKPEDFMDMRFVSELEKQGFFKGSGSKQ